MTAPTVREVMTRTMRAVRDGAARGETVDALAARGAVTISPDVPVDSAVRLMEATRAERLLVVTDDRKLLGTLSRRQVLRASVPQGAGRRAGPESTARSR